MKKKRFIGNGKNNPIIVHGVHKYRRYVQVVMDKKTGKIKRINHTVLVS